MRPLHSAAVVIPVAGAVARPGRKSLLAAAFSACCLLALGFGGAGAAPVPACQTDLGDELENLDVPGLSAAIVKHGRLVCASAAGMAEIDQRRAVTPDTLFLIASVSKTVTATALMQLYEQGKFALDDDVSKYLPFKLSIPFSPDSPVTFRQLLTHTASIDDNPLYINCPGWCTYGSAIAPFVTRGADSPLSLADFTRGYLTPGGPYYDWAANFESAAPGTKTDYSNMGIVIVGYLVEVMSGVPFDQYCKEHIFTPLSMEKTSWRLAGIDQSILAMPYDEDANGFVPYGQYGEPDYPDGMLRTSATELAHFLIAYMDGGQYGDQRILKSETVNEILKTQTPLEEAQGLVWVEHSVGDRTVWGHDGADNGAGADMWFDPEEDEGVILLTNGVWNDESDLVERLFDEADEY